MANDPKSTEPDHDRTGNLKIDPAVNGTAEGDLSDDSLEKVNGGHMGNNGVGSHGEDQPAETVEYFF